MLLEGLALPLDFIILHVDGEAHRLLDLKLIFKKYINSYISVQLVSFLTEFYVFRNILLRMCPKVLETSKG